MSENVEPRLYPRSGLEPEKLGQLYGQEIKSLTAGVDLDIGGCTRKKVCIYGVNEEELIAYIYTAGQATISKNFSLVQALDITGKNWPGSSPFNNETSPLLI